MGFSSDRSSSSSCKGKPSSPQFLSLLEQQLPKPARSLTSSLSEDDREVLTYMLAFGLHLQMLAGVVFPAQKLHWKSWKSSSPAKVGLTYERIFAQSFDSVSSKSRSKPGKASSLFPHKSSCSCDCFSCYSSFWSRWAASPNRDLLSKIIEITEEEEDRKAEKGKQNSKKQEKKQVLGKGAGGKKSKGEKSKLQATGTSKLSVLPPAMSKLAESMPTVQNPDVASTCTSMDMMYDSLWDKMIMDQSPSVVTVSDSVMRMEVRQESFHAGPDMKECLAGSATMLEKQSIVPLASFDEAHATSPWGQDRTSIVLEDEADGSFPAQASPLQGKSIPKLHRISKRKINQIMPVDFEGLPMVKEDDEKSVQLNESAEGCESPRLMDANIRDRGVLSRVFPHPLCDIASRLWDLVSLGPRGHLMEYY